jgi:hypothetical protein
MSRSVNVTLSPLRFVPMPPVRTFLKAGFFCLFAISGILGPEVQYQRTPRDAIQQQPERVSLGLQRAGSQPVVLLKLLQSGKDEFFVGFKDEFVKAIDLKLYRELSPSDSECRTKARIPAVAPAKRTEHE